MIVSSTNGSFRKGKRQGRILMSTTVYPRHTGDATPPFVRNLAIGMVELGWDVMVLAPHGTGALRHELDAGVEVRRFRYAYPTALQRLCYEGGMLINLRKRQWTTLLLPSFLLAQWIALRRLIREWDPDLLHSHSLLPQGFTGCWAGMGHKIPHVTTSHGNDVFGLPAKGLAGRAKRYVLRHASNITVNSSATEAAVFELGCPIEKITRIPAVPNQFQSDPQWVDRIRRDAIGEHSPVLAFVGRMIEEKGVSDLLSAILILRAEFPQIRCLLLGEGQDRETFEKRAHSMGIADALHWAGWVNPNLVTSWISVADVMVVPSRMSASGWREAQGLVVAEAMLAGVPVVATNAGGIPDMLDSGATGVLVTPENPIQLAEGIRVLLKNPPQRRQIAQTARERANRFFSRDAVFSAHEALYRKLIRKEQTQ